MKQFTNHPSVLAVSGTAYAYCKLQSTGRFKCAGMVDHAKRDFYARYWAGMIEDNKPAGYNGVERGEGAETIFVPEFLGDQLSPEEAARLSQHSFKGGVSLNDPKEQSFYVVSDVWTGRAEHFCDFPERAAHNQYLEVLQEQGFTEESDQSGVMAEQFRAWPAATWPEDMEFAEVFDWIGEQRAKALGLLLAATA